MVESRDEENHPFREFGIFLVAIGSVWLALVVPLDLSALTEPLLFPISIIVAGAASIFMAFARLPRMFRKAVSIIFIVWFVLLVRANFLSFTIAFPFTAVGGDQLYENSFTVTESTAVTLACDSCRVYLRTSENDELRVVFNYSSLSNPVVQETEDSLRVELDRAPGIGFSNDLAEFYLNPAAKTVTISTGAGSATLETSRATVSRSLLIVNTGAGSIEIADLNSLGFESVNILTGAGSAEIVVGSVDGDKTLDIDTGAGSIEISLPSNVPHKIKYNSGVGSFSYPGRSCSFICNGEFETSDYSSAENRIFIDANTGVGSIETTLTEV